MAAILTKGVGHFNPADTSKLDEPSLLLYLHQRLLFGHSLINEHHPDHLKWRIFEFGLVLVAIPQEYNLSLLY